MLVLTGTAAIGLFDRIYSSMDTGTRGRADDESAGLGGRRTNGFSV